MDKVTELNGGLVFPITMPDGGKRRFFIRYFDEQANRIPQNGAQLPPGSIARVSEFANKFFELAQQIEYRDKKLNPNRVVLIVEIPKKNAFLLLTKEENESAYNKLDANDYEFEKFKDSELEEVTGISAKEWCDAALNIADFAGPKLMVCSYEEEEEEESPLPVKEAPRRVIRSRSEAEKALADGLSEVGDPEVVDPEVVDPDTDSETS